MEGKGQWTAMFHDEPYTLFFFFFKLWACIKCDKNIRTLKKELISVFQVPFTLTGHNRIFLPVFIFKTEDWLSMQREDFGLDLVAKLISPQRSRKVGLT